MFQFRISKAAEEKRKQRRIRKEEKRKFRKRMKEETLGNDFTFDCFGINRKKKIGGKWETDESYHERKKKEIASLKELRRKYDKENTTDKN